MSAVLLIGDDFLRRIDFFTGIVSSLVKPVGPSVLMANTVPERPLRALTSYEPEL
jgi:hypothetical protein